MYMHIVYTCINYLSITSVLKFPNHYTFTIIHPFTQFTTSEDELHVNVHCICIATTFFIDIVKIIKQKMLNVWADCMIMVYHMSDGI